jgi:hypothetical protein
MICPLCGLDNDPSASRCASCDATLSAPPYPPAYASVGEPAPSPPAFATTYVPRRQVLTPQRLLLAIGLIGVIGVAALIVIRGGDDAHRADPAVPPGTSSASPTTSPAPGPTTATAPASPRDQAAVINALLDRSVASRRKLNNAIDRVRRCTDLSGALADMRTVGVERDQQIADADAADVTALQDGERLRSTLKSALGFALAADRHFVAWAEPAIVDGCDDTAARQAAWASGQASSTQAQVAKKQLVEAWNLIAAQLGFAQRTTQFI